MTFVEGRSEKRDARYGMGDTGRGLVERMSDHRWLMTDNGYSAPPRPRRVDIPVRYTTTAPSTPKHAATRLSPPSPTSNPR